MRLIDADALMEAVEKDFEGVCVYDVPPSEAVSDFERIVDSMPTIAGLPNFDAYANAVFDRATSGRNLRFRETDEMCPACQRDLEVYYCENRTYIVRCKHCHIVTLVAASNPYEAAEKVGLHVKPVRHGQWIDDGPNWICSWCGTEFKDEIEFIEGAGNYYMPHYCPHCSAEMDLQEEIL